MEGRLITHKLNREDVYEAWDRVRAVTRCEGLLERDGASWRVNGGPVCLARWLYGSASMVLALRAYLEGWIDQQKEAKGTGR